MLRRLFVPLACVSLALIVACASDGDDGDQPEDFDATTKDASHSDSKGVDAPAKAEDAAETPEDVSEKPDTATPGKDAALGCGDFDNECVGSASYMKACGDGKCFAGYCCCPTARHCRAGSFPVCCPEGKTCKDTTNGLCE